LAEQLQPPIAVAQVSVGLTGICSVLLGSLLPSILDDLQLTSVQTGILTGLPGFGYLLGVLLAGFLGDRVGYRLFWRLGALAGALATLGLALSPTLGLMLFSAALLGLVPGFFDGSINPLLVSLVEERSSSVLNQVHSFFGIGVTAGPLLIGAALAWGVGWRWQFAAAALLAALVLLVVLRQRLPRLKRQLPPLLDALKASSLWRAMTAAAMYGGMEIVMLSWTVLYLVRIRGVAESAASLAIALFGIILMLGRFATSRIVQHIGAFRMISGGGLVAALGFLLVVILPGKVFPWVGIGITALGMSGILLTVTAEAGRSVPGLEGTVTALVSAASGLGKMLLPLLIGILARQGNLLSAILLGVCCAMVLMMAYARQALRPLSLGFTGGETSRPE